MSRDAAPGSQVVLSTDTVRERERLDYWRDIVCDTFVELECRAGADQGFYGSIESRKLGRHPACEGQLDGAARRSHQQADRALPPDAVLSEG